MSKINEDSYRELYLKQPDLMANLIELIGKFKTEAILQAIAYIDSRTPDPPEAGTQAGDRASYEDIETNRTSLRWALESHVAQGKRNAEIQAWLLLKGADAYTVSLCMQAVEHIRNGKPVDLDPDDLEEYKFTQ